MSVRKYEWTQHIVNPKNVQRMHDCMHDVCVLVCVCVWEGGGGGGGWSVSSTSTCNHHPFFTLVAYYYVTVRAVTEPYLYADHLVCFFL